MITTIKTDCFEVLINGIWGGGKMGELVEQKLGLTREQYAQKDNEKLWQIFLQLNRGKLTEIEYWNEVVKETGWRCTPEQLIALSNEVTQYRVPGTLEVIQRLHDAGYELYLISDIWTELKQRILRDYPWINSLFKDCFFSCDHGKIKADPNFFEDLAKAWGTNPQECLFIDDYYVNTENAAKAGYKTIIFKNALQLENELRNNAIIL